MQCAACGTVHRQSNEVDRGYETLRRIALQTLLQDAADIDDLGTSRAAAAASAAGRSQTQQQQQPDRGSLSPPSHRRGHRRNASEAAVVFDSRTSTDGLTASDIDRLATPAGRSGSKSPGRGTSGMDLGSRGHRSLSPSQAAAISSVLALGVDQPGAASTVSVIQAAMNRQRAQATELKASLDAARDENASLRKQLDTSTAERRRTETELNRLQEERDGA